MPMRELAFGYSLLSRSYLRLVTHLTSGILENVGRLDVAVAHVKAVDVMEAPSSLRVRAPNTEMPSRTNNGLTYYLF